VREQELVAEYTMLIRSTVGTGILPAAMEQL